VEGVEEGRQEEELGHHHVLKNGKRLWNEKEKEK
jgi:hypothetical protein